MPNPVKKSKAGLLFSVIRRDTRLDKELIIIFNIKSCLNCQTEKRYNVFMRILLVILSFSLFFSCKKDTYFEHEPNDRYDHANTLEVDRPVQGYLSTAADLDTYVTDIAEPGSFDLALSAVKGVNVALKVYKNETPDPVLVKTIDDARKSSPERMKNLWFERGRYFLVVLHGDRDELRGETESSYTLKMSINSRVSDEEHEPNDTFDQANPIISGTVTGYFSPAFNKKQGSDNVREEDYYSIDIEASKESPQIMDITLSGVNGVTATVELFDPDRKAVAAGRSEMPGAPVSLPGRGITRSGKYYLSVYSASFESEHETPYHLKIEIRDFDRSFELEPNNSIADAYVFPDMPVKGTIFPSDDRDFYKITCTEPVLFSATLTCADGLDGVLGLYDGQGKKICEVNTFGAGKPERIAPIYVKGDVYAEVSSRGKVQSKDASYQIEILKEPVRDDSEIEPNDSLSQAQKIGSKITGYLNYKKDKDFYLIESSARMNRKFTITGIDKAVFTVSLTDSHGYIVRSEKVSSEKGISFKDMIDGKAYLIIESEREVPFGPYTVTIGDKP
jgi:hypothetical protein